MSSLTVLRKVITAGAPNVVLRVGSAASRFILLIFLARYSSSSDVGLFGLVAATVTFGLYVVGLDFYVFSTRELLRVGPSERASIVRDQIALQSATYCLVIPLSLLVFAGGLLPWSLAGWFLLILVGDHVSLELHRLLIALEQPVRASVVFFVGSGAWVFPWIAAVLIRPNLMDLGTLWPAWVVGDAVAIALGIRWYRQLVPRSPPLAPDRRRILHGLRVALPYLASTLAIKLMGTLDRHVLEFFRDTSEVGVYVLFAGIANGLLIVVEAGATSIWFPPMVAAFQQGRYRDYQVQARRFARLLVSVTAVATVGIGVAVSPLLALIGDRSYLDDREVFWILLVAVMLGTLALVPHYQLYARNHDRPIVMSSVAGLVVACTLHFVLVPGLGAMGSALATLAGYGTILFGKSAAAWKHRSGRVRLEDQV